MAEEITVDSKSGLNTIANNSQDAAEYYIDGSAAAYQAFTVKTSDQQGAALTAFIEKINNLSSQVFSVYPGLLSNYASSITTYTGVMDDEGFSGDKIYTHSDDIASIKDWLTVQRYNSVSEKGAALDKAISAAADALAQSPSAMDIGDVNTSLIVYAAQETLSTHAKSYQNTHDNLMAAKDSFVKSLGEVETGLTQVQTYLTNALNLAAINTDELVGWVVNGQLNVGNMSYLDAVQDSNDIQVLSALMSDQSMSDKMAAIGNVNPDHISQSMMNIVYTENYKLLDDYKKTGNPDSLDALETFVVTITGNDHSQDYVQTYMIKLGTAGEIYASYISSQATSLMPDVNAYGGNYDQYVKDFNAAQAYISTVLAPNMATAQSLGSLYDTIYLMGLGKYKAPLTGRESNNKGQYKAEADIYLKKGSLSFSNGDFSFDTTGTETWKSINNGGQTDIKQVGTANTVDPSDRINARLATDYDTVSAAGNISAMKELEEAKQEAVNDFWKDTLKTGAGAVLPPGFDVVAQVAIDLSSLDSDQSQAISAAIGDGQAAYTGKYANGVHAGTNTILSVVNLVDELHDLDVQKDQEAKDLQNNLFNTGGSTYAQGTDVQGGSYMPSYDLQSILYADDLEKNGVKGYVVRQAAQEGQNITGAVQSFEKNVEATSYSKTDKAFLNGTGHQTIEKYGIDNLYDTLSSMSDTSPEGGRDVDGNYYVGFSYEGDYRDQVNAQFDAFVPAGG